MGFGITHNGWDWEALPSPEMHPVIEAEVGAVEYFPIPGSAKGKWFSILGHQPGMVVYSADSPEGPYFAATKNYAVLTGNCYFARFFRGVNQSEVLVTHQAYSHVGHTYIAPYKLADVDAEGTLRFKWWAQNEGLKGQPLPPAALTRGCSSVESCGFFASPVNVSEGVVLEVASVTLPSSAPAAGKELEELPGFILEVIGGRVSYVAVTATGGCIVGEIVTANTTAAPGKYQTWERQLPSLSGGGGSVSLRLLYRRDMLELYVDDYLLPVVLQSGAGSGRLGLLSNAASAKMGGGLKGFQMTLPGTAQWPLHPPPPPPPPPRPVPASDLAKGGPTNCTGCFEKDPQFSCDKGADGNLATRWSSNTPYDGSARSWQVDLGKAQPVGSVRISWEAAFAKSYSLESSVDGKVWSKIFTTSAGKGNVETMDNLSAHGRFVRIVCTERFSGSAWGFSFYELEAFASKTAPPPTQLPSPR